MAATADDIRWVNALYMRNEGRLPTAREMVDIQRAFNEGWTRASFERHVDKLNDVPGFVRRTFVAEYGRQPSAAELAHHTDAITSGSAGRRDWSNWLKSTNEAQTHRIKV